ncbi:MAG: cpnA2 [Hydrocarboniphaga sp.]|uniref:SDR family NAD(P)-dependent oxidoreductase n=1 Tax=Hydrocarboniphaga sp. TaxID=2033016 RepID=UPI00261DE324|nr:SDR family NAD(P)-dependent oxidoreductase [Hydrocarboniphaga sp.]MDB5970039.1 cpnA2 [Hydrocarboniphaga sp.]
MRLENEVAIVTGSTKGLGRFVAERYAAEGAKVVVSGRNAEAGNRVVAQIAAKGGSAIFVRADVMIEEDVKNLIKTAVDTFGKLSIMVNNACPTEFVYDAAIAGDASGSATSRRDGSVRNISTENWQQLILGTLTQVFWCCKYSIPEIAKAGGGSIINVSSQSGMQAQAGLAGYSSGKSALFGLTRSIAIEEAPNGIRCNCICVGVIPGEAPAAADKAEAAAWEGEVGSFGWAIRTAPLLGMGEGGDMANLALFLGSRESKYLTGLIVPVDGGWTINSHLPSLDLLHKEAEQTRAKDRGAA